MLIDPDKPVTGNRESAHKKDEMDKEDPTQGMSEWFQPFTDNLEDLETHVPAHSSERENSDSEGAAKVVTQKRKHSIYTHFPKDRDCDVATVVWGGLGLPSSQSHLYPQRVLLPPLSLLPCIHTLIHLPTSITTTKSPPSYPHYFRSFCTCHRVSFVVV